MVAIFSKEEIDDFLSSSSSSIPTSIDADAIASTSHQNPSSASFLKISKLELPLINFDLNIDDSDIDKYLVKRETDDVNNDASSNSKSSSTLETSSQEEAISSSSLADTPPLDNSSSAETSPINSTSDCISCASAPTCPVCASDEQCILTTRTCDQCPTVYCSKINSSISQSLINDNSNNSSAKIGGIVGGVVFAFLVLLGVGLYFIYKKWYIKAYPNGFIADLDDDKEDLMDDEDEDGYMLSNNDIRKRQSTVSLSTMANSVLTKASNVINITYIPGVTVKNTNPKLLASRKLLNNNSSGSANGNTRTSLFSRDTYFSDIETASIGTGEAVINDNNKKGVKLVSMENNYYEDDAYDNENDNNNNLDQNYYNNKNMTTKKMKNQ
ncbi:unnamed protein product [[Candida] boidinii]|uniref:Unnamed protein product n=1 Tax=Candida boidinii TaxID=5477 RepID=A0A9W6T4N5_CANBO|nr:unnamed protein product [[Candida] boidinii]